MQLHWLENGFLLNTNCIVVLNSISKFCQKPLSCDLSQPIQVSEDTKIENQMTDKFETHPYVVHFDFLGKDSMRYQNSIGVPKVSFFLYTVGTIK